MSFMAVAYVPAFLEDRANYVKERANGLYGATSFVVANFLIGLPYLCKCPHPGPISSLTSHGSLHRHVILLHSLLVIKL